MVLLDNARKLDEQDHLRRSLAGGEPQNNEATLQRSLSGEVASDVSLATGEIEGEIVDFAEFSRRVLARGG